MAFKHCGLRLARAMLAGCVVNMIYSHSEKLCTFSSQAKRQFFTFLFEAQYGVAFLSFAMSGLYIVLCFGGLIYG